MAPAIPGALVFHTVALTSELTSQFEGRTRCTVGAALKMPPPSIVLLSPSVLQTKHEL